MNLRVVISLIDELSDVSSSTYGVRKAVHWSAGKKNNVSGTLAYKYAQWNTKLRCAKKVY